MEVKIKNNGEMLDATIEMVDGVMVVSPKVEKFEPKDGDVLSCFFYGKYQGTFVFEEAGECGEAIFHVVLDADGKFIKGNGCSYFGYIYDACPATEEEKKKLFDKLAEEGYEWNAEKKRLSRLSGNLSTTKKFMLQDSLFMERIRFARLKIKHIVIQCNGELYMKEVGTSKP